LATATTLNNLSIVYGAQGRYEEALKAYGRALAIYEKALGPDHPLVATSLNNLAMLYYAQGRYGEAEPLYKRSLSIREKRLGPDHPVVGRSLNNLAELYRAQGRYAEAEPLYKRTVSIFEKAPRRRPAGGQPRTIHRRFQAAASTAALPRYRLVRHGTAWQSPPAV